MLKVTYWRSLSYTMVVLIITFTRVLTLLFNAFLEPSSLFLLFLTVVVISAYLGGLNLGLLTTVLGMLGRFFLAFLTNGFWTPSLSVTELLQLAFFVFQGGLISVLIGKLHQAKNQGDAGAGFKIYLPESAPPKLELKRGRSKCFKTLPISSHLSEKEDFFDQVAENLGDVFWLLSTKTNQMLYVSSAYEKVWGRTCQELYEKPLSFLEGIHPEDRDRITEARKNNELKGNYNEKYRIIKPDGSIRWIHSRAFPIRDALGIVNSIAGISQDITEQQEIEAALQQSESRFRQLVDANLLGIGFGNSDGMITEANDTFLHIVGYSREDLQAGQVRWNLMTPPEYQELDEQAIQQILESGVCTPYQKEYIRKDGTRIPILIGATHLKTADAEVACFVLDLTSQQQKQLELQRADERFQLASKAANCLIYDWDIQDNIVYRTQGLAQVLGYDPQSVEQTSSWWRELIHPDDQQLLLTEKSRILEDPEIEIFNVEYRVRHQQGAYVYVCDRGVVCRNAEGKAVRMVGFTLDINSHKQVEQELYRREQEFFALAQNSPDIIARIDKELRHIYVNPAIEMATGKLPQNIIGKTFAELELTSEECLWWERMVGEVFKTAQEKVREFEYPSPDGTIRYYQTRIVPELAQDGAVVSVLLVGREITNLKKIEVALRKSESKFRRLVDSNIIGVIFWEIDGKIWDANDAFLQMVGYTRSDLKNGRLNWRQMTPLEQLQGSDRSIVEMRLSGTAAPLEKEYICKNGKRVPVLLGGVMFEGSTEQGVSFVLDLTVFKSTEMALRESEKRFRRLVESDIFGAVFGTFDGGIHYANDYFLKMIGYDRETLVQGRLRWDEITPPEYAHLDAQAIQELQVFGVAKSFEKEYICKDGRHTPALVGMTLLQENEQAQQEVIGFILDLTQQKQVEKERQQLLSELEKSIHQLEAVVGSMTEGLIVANSEGDILLINPAALRIYGYQNEEVVHQKIWDFLTNFELKDLNGCVLSPASLPLVRALRGETFYDYEVRVRQLNGERVWIASYGGTPVRDASGEVIFAVVTMRDVTEQKRSQTALTESFKREQAARTEAEAANHLKDEFLAVLSHELRSPLNPILGWTKLLRNGNLNAAMTAQALETIERNAKLQIQLVEDLLDVSQILRGKLALNITLVNLAATIEAALLTVRLASQSKCIEIQTHFEDNLGLVLGDAGRLQQVFWNLLANAVKFTPQGGRVAVRLFSQETETASTAIIQISDTGKGIKAEFLPYVFDYFRQESSAMTRVFGGLGLGLAIVRHLVELHGGRVYAESPGVGKGATFTVKLPLTTVCPQDTPQSQSFAVDLTGLQILVVDEAQMGEFLLFLLEAYGARVRVVTSAKEVLPALMQFKFDLLISDLDLPQVDGYRLIRQIRAMPAENGEIFAIALTADASEAEQQEILASGFQMHLAKPIESAALVTGIAKLVGRHE